MFWLGAIISLCYVPGLTGAYIATQWPLLAVVLMFGLLRRGPFTWLHGLGLLFLVYATVHMWFTPTPQASVFGWWLVVITGLILWFGTTLDRDVKDDVQNLYRGLAIGAGASSVTAVLQYFGLDWPPTTSVFPAGLYVNSTQQGTVLALLVVALMTEGMWKWVLPLLPGIALSGSRGAWAALAIGIVSIGIRRVWLATGAAAVLAWHMFVSSPLSPSDTERLLIWSTAWKSLNLLGWGPGVFYNIMIPQPGSWLFPEHAHNDALQLAFEYGAGAALPLIIFAFALSRTSDREWPVVLAGVVASFYSAVLWMPLASFLVLVAVGRVLRTYGMDVSLRGDRRQHVLPWWRSRTRSGCGAVSVSSRHSAGS